MHVWSREDVIHVAKNNDKSITLDDADEILSNIERHIDCELGITWQSIEIAVDDFDIEKEKIASY